MSEVHQLKGLFINANDYDEDIDEELDFLNKNGIKGVTKFVPAYNIKTNEKVLCKVFNPEPLKSNSVATTKKIEQCCYKQLLIMRESIFLKELRHPTIVNIKGINLYNRNIIFNESDDDSEISDSDIFYTNPTIFLEFIKPKSLLNVLKSGLVLPAYKRQIIMIGLSASIRYLHSKNVLHRSLNPHTILLDSNDHPKIFDFSTIRHSDIKGDVSMTTLQPSGLIYQAPEIAQTAVSKYDKPVDIFALGRLLYLMATGYEAFKHPSDNLKEKSEYYILNLVINKNVIPFFPSEVPKKLVSLIVRCWKINPSERPTAEEVYQFIAEKPKHYINKFSESELLEIKDYCEMIQKYERDKVVDNKLKIVELNSLHIPFSSVPEDGSGEGEEETVNKIPTNESLQIQMLAKITSSNFAYCNEDTTLELLNAMADNGSIKEPNRLLQVSDFVNNLNERNNKFAERFLEKMYGSYIITSNDVKVIMQGTITNKSIRVANIPPWIERIGPNAFAGFDNLELVNIPNSVLVIDQNAFNGCTKLLVVNIPESICQHYLGKFAFQDCSSLTCVRTPGSLTKILEGTFKGDTSLKNVMLNNGLVGIDKEAFDMCSELESIVIPKTVTRIAERAFHKCTALKNVFFRGKRPMLGNGAISHHAHKTSI